MTKWTICPIIYVWGEEMELIQSVIIKALQEEKISIKLNMHIEKITNSICFMSLHRIKEVLENEKLSDFDCIEKIINIFEDIGCGVENRHDF